MYDPSKRMLSIVPNCARWLGVRVWSTVETLDQEQCLLRSCMRACSLVSYVRLSISKLNGSLPLVKMSGAYWTSQHYKSGTLKKTERESAYIIIGIIMNHWSDIWFAWSHSNELEEAIAVENMMVWLHAKLQSGIPSCLHILFCWFKKLNFLQSHHK